MSRRSARKNAFFLLFQLEFVKDGTYEETKELFFQETEEPIEEVDKAFIIQEVTGTREHLKEIDAMINQAAKDWNSDRMSRVDLTILRLAVYEIKFSFDTPFSVAINEAVELAKKYSSEEAPAFINGILGKIA